MTTLNLSGLYGVAKGNSIRLNLAPDTVYRPFPGNDVKLNLNESLPTGDLVLNLGPPPVEPPATQGYTPTFDLELTSDPYVPTFNIQLGRTVIPPSTAPTVIVSAYAGRWGIASKADSTTTVIYGQTDTVDTDFNCVYERAAVHDTATLLNQVLDLTQINKGHKLVNGPFENQLNKDYLIRLNRTFTQQNKGYKIGFEQLFRPVHSDYTMRYTIPPTKDTDYKFRYNSVRLNGVERIPIFEGVVSGYLPTGRIALSGITSYLPTSDLSLRVQRSGDEPRFLPYEAPAGNALRFNLNETYDVPAGNSIRLEIAEPDNSAIEREIIGFELTPIQPTGSPFKAQFGPTTNNIDIDRRLSYGYGLNNFVIGGVTTLPNNNPDPEPEPDPPIIHIDYEVYRVVNIVNITVQPGGEIINFDNFSLTRDIESFSWTCTFDVLDRASFNLIKPVGRSLKTVDININGTIFNVFIGRTTTNTRHSGQVFRCTGWSQLKRLSYPYSARRSFTDTQARTAAQVVTNELTGTGHTVDWQTIDWQIPAGIHTYQNKTSLGAVLNVVNGIGGVIVPHNAEPSFMVRPYYPVSPWNWDNPSTQINRVMSESQFFTIDNETIPRDNPNGVYVYGEEQGVGVFAVRAGTAGNELLPDVVDRYITANTAGQERGRIEVARNSFIESIPMTTYVDENGIIMPQELIEFNDTDGGTWRGMVIQTTVNCTRIGTALSQSITVARFFDG